MTSPADFGDLQKWPIMKATKILHIYPLPFWKWQTKGNAKVLTETDLGNLQKWPLRECIFTPTWFTFLKMADHGRSIGNLCSWLIKVTSNGGHPNTAYSPLHDIPYWKQQTKVNVLLTSAAVLQYSKVTSNWHIFTPTWYLYENGQPMAMHLWPLQLICVTPKSDL